MAAILFAICVTILAVGWLWFYIARPMLEGFGWIVDEETVNDYENSDPYVMSRSDDSPSPSLRPSLETGNETDRQTEPAARIKAEELLTLCKVMRAAGIGREEASAAFKASGLPFNNNVWRDAAPAQSRAGDAEYRTPIVGRPTSAKFETDPDYPYQAPA